MTRSAFLSMEVYTSICSKSVPSNHEVFNQKVGFSVTTSVIRGHDMKAPLAFLLMSTVYSLQCFHPETYLCELSLSISHDSYWGA